jgi:hypothetical protein
VARGFIEAVRAFLITNPNVWRIHTLDAVALFLTIHPDERRHIHLQVADGIKNPDR